MKTPTLTRKGGRLKQDTTYYEAHYEELLEQYPEQWVAIYQQKVVGTASDGRELLLSLKEKGFPLRHVLVKHLTREEEVWILAA